MTIMEAFRRNLVALRRRRKMTQAALAMKAGLSKPYVSLMEAGRRVPSLEVIEKLARGLGTQASALMNDHQRKEEV